MFDIRRMGMVMMMRMKMTEWSVSPEQRDSDYQGRKGAENFWYISGKFPEIYHEKLRLGIKVLSFFYIV